MVLVDGKCIMDYIKEQMDIYDGINLKLEQKFIHDSLSIYDKTGDDILNLVDAYVYNDSSVLAMQTLVNKFVDRITSMYNDWYKILIPAVTSYWERGYNQFGDLIDIGKEVQGEVAKQQAQVHEIRLNPDEYSIDFMRSHAFEMIKDISDDMINKLRVSLSTLMIQHGYTKGNVTDTVQDILKTNRSRAEMIAQTEMSTAYNAGVLERMNEFNSISSDKMKKYWYGFKYSEVTCSYCRPRIGTVYDADDDSEHLPAHPRCRCVWLPYMEGWEDPISTDITRKADMLKRQLRPDEVYDKINSRLGIDYADYIPEDLARQYIAGNRSQAIKDAIDSARQVAIKSTMDDFDIVAKSTEDIMNKEFSVQMNFWKKYTAEMMVDNNTDNLRKSYEAIKGVMVLPWTPEQLDKWNKLLNSISNRL